MFALGQSDCGNSSHSGSTMDASRSCLKGYCMHRADFAGGRKLENTEIMLESG